MTKYLHGARALGTPADVNTDGQTLLSGYAKVCRRVRRRSALEAHLNRAPLSVAFIAADAKIYFSKERTQNG